MSGVNFDFINSSVSSVVNSAEATLRTTVASLDPTNTSPTQLLMLQQDVSKWTMMTQIQSTLVKELSDTMKGIIQKAG